MTFLQTILTFYGCGAVVVALAILFTPKQEREGVLINAAGVMFWPITVAILLSGD